MDKRERVARAIAETDWAYQECGLLQLHWKMADAAIAALEPVTVQRCAECDCDNPPDGCNWIAAEPAQITVQEAARVLLMVEEMEVVADVARQFRISEPAFFAALRALAEKE